MLESAPALPTPPAPELPATPGGARAPAGPAPAPAESPAQSPAPAAPSPDQTAPADLDRVARWWERLAWYAGAAVLTCLLVFFGLRLDRADLRAPFYYDLDSLLILPMVKATVERGFGGHWRNERMGAPGVLELYDFPVIDHLHFFLIWFLSKAVTNVILLYNLYFLLTFPLTTLTAMIAFRHLGLTLPAAAVGGLLYSFLPYHYQRWENHYFLAAYWMVPLSMLPAFAIGRGDLPFFRWLPDGTYRRRLLAWRTVGVVLLGAATASAGAYYAFFACAFIAFAGCYAAVAFRSWRPLASAGGVVAVVVVFGLANHLPTFVYHWKYDRNPVTDRFPEEADTYGLKVTHLVLPINDHNLRLFNRVKWAYFSPSRPAENENQSATLGLIGAAGLIGLVVAVLFPARRGWPYGPLSAMVLFALLLATVGGFGSVFNLLVTAQIRGYNRISVFIALIALFASLWAVDRFLLTRTSPRARRLRYPAWGAILLLGFLDQTPHGWFKSGIISTIDEQASRFRGDADFFARIEQAMPPGAKVFCLPYIPFPEYRGIEKMPVYEHARGYIHTDTLVWSFGAVKGREAAAWQLEVTSRGAEELLQRVVYRGFDGLLVDKRGYPTTISGNRATLLIEEIQRKYTALVKDRTGQRNARLPEIVHTEDGQQIFLDLRPYRDELRNLLGPDHYEAEVTREREWVAVIWLNGFCGPEDPAEYNRLRHGPPDGKAVIINPSDRTRTFRLRMTFGVNTPGPFHLRLSGLAADEFDLDKRPADWPAGGPPARFGVEREYVVEVPPGRHAIRFRCTPPAHFIPDDHRKLCYFIKDFRMEER
jgi:hypothetical protein